MTKQTDTEIIDCSLKHPSAHIYIYIYIRYSIFVFFFFLTKCFYINACHRDKYCDTFKDHLNYAVI